MERFCLECNTLVNGRADKKFCDDHCRSSYNHRLKVDEHSFVNLINQILKKNRRILKGQTLSPKKYIKREDLLIKGFDFNYYTYCFKASEGENYFFCYEYGYAIQENQELLLVKKEEI